MQKPKPQQKPMVIEKDYSRFGFREADESVYKTKKGLSKKIVEEISKIKKEPQWMLDFRLKAFEFFQKRPLPTWGADLSGINFDEIVYYIRPTEKQAKSWEDLPEGMRRTFEKLGIPEAERKFLAGVGGQYDSEVVYHKLKEDLEKQGVIFTDMDTGLREYPEIVKKYFGTIVPPNDNKFAALNSAVWSGGSFVYVPEGVEVKMPLQAYFRINSENMGQFERTLIIAEPNSKVHYIEGCTAATYQADALHAAVVEIVALPGAHVRYTTLQNWSNNVYNLVTKRARAYENAFVEWLDANLGCLAEGTKIFSNPSLKNIEDVLPNDNVFAYDESTKSLVPKKVLGTKFSGVKPTYRVALGKGKREIIATMNHPFLKLRYDRNRHRKLGRYTFEWACLAEIRRGDLLLVPTELPDVGKPRKMESVNYERKSMGGNQYGARFEVDTSHRYNEFNSPQLTTEDLMWLLGVYIGDGSSYISTKTKNGSNKYGVVTFSVPDTDPIRPKIISLTKSIFGLGKYTERKDKVCISYNSLLFAEWLGINGFSGNAHTKILPNWVFTLPKSQKLAFIAGYLEADGYLREGSIRMKSCNDKIVEGIRDLSFNCGIHVNKITVNREIKSLKINGPNAPENEYVNYVTFMSNLEGLKPFLARANKKKIGKGKNYHFKHVTETRRLDNLPRHLAILPVTSIKYEGEKPTYDLEIENAHNFVANGIIVHNSKVTMKYPSIFLMGRGARAEILSIAFAGKGQNLDAGAKAVHLAPDTSSKIVNKSVSRDGGRTNFRGYVKIFPGAVNSKSHTKCDALILDEKSNSGTIPQLEIDENKVNVGHEATVGKVGEEQLFYLMSRGLSEDEAVTMIVNGFFETFTKELPLEYAIEFNRLIQLEMTGAVG